MAKILITESVHPIGPELLTAAGHTVVYADRDMDIFRREIVDADAVLVRIIELPGSLLATAKNLKIVSKHGVGYDNIDLDYCKSHGIAVTITPNANSLSVAEHAFTLMLTLAKNIIPVSNEYRTVGFAAKNHAPGIEMTGKTLGLIGMGRIGKHILHMCRDGLDKHRCTDAALRYFKSEVMEMCHREGLYQIDLLNGSKNRITEREYWAQKKGQAALDKQNTPMIADGITPRQTKFETNKEKLRQTIGQALATATSFDEFSSLLLQEGVAVKESRGRLSYLTPDRTKPITARKLGDDFDRAAVLAVLEQNAARATEKAAAIPEYPRQEKTSIQPTKAPRTVPKQDGVQRLVDIEQKKAEGKGRGYERWATMHNLKQMAATLNVYHQYGFTSPEQLEAALDTAYGEMSQTSGELKALETKLQGKKELQRQVLAYAKTKPARDGLKAQKSEKARAAYRQANESDFIIADAAARYFKAHGITKLPARKALQAEIEQLISEKDGLYNTYHEQKQRFKELQTVKRNIDQILRREEPHRRKEQSHER